jgi:hypothetical protein
LLIVFWKICPKGTLPLFWAGWWRGGEKAVETPQPHQGKTLPQKRFLLLVKGQKC